MRSIHAVIFDMDGLVFESERIAMRAFIRTAHHFGFQMNELMHLNLTGRVEEDCAAQMQRMYGQDKDVRAWRAYLRECTTICHLPVRSIPVSRSLSTL